MGLGEKYGRMQISAHECSGPAMFSYFAELKKKRFVNE